MQSLLPGQQSRRERQSASRNAPRRLQRPRSLSPCPRSMQLQKLGMLSSACPFNLLQLVTSSHLSGYQKHKGAKPAS